MRGFVAVLFVSKVFLAARSLSRLGLGCASYFGHGYDGLQSCGLLDRRPGGVDPAISRSDLSTFDVRSASTLDCLVRE